MTEMRAQADLLLSPSSWTLREPSQRPRSGHADAVSNEHISSSASATNLRDFRSLSNAVGNPSDDYRF